MSRARVRPNATASMGRGALSEAHRPAHSAAQSSAHSDARASAEVMVNRAAAESVRRGHPWIWREALTRGPRGIEAGGEVLVVDPTGATLGRGVLDPGSPIAVRMWTLGE